MKRMRLNEGLCSFRLAHTLCTYTHTHTPTLYLTRVSYTHGTANTTAFN